MSATNTGWAAVNAIEKLTGANNYHYWMVLMRQHLCQEKVWNTIESDTSTGLLNNNADSMSSALSRIFFSVSRTVLGNIERETSPLKAWSILKELYGDSGPNKLVRILRKLVMTKLDNFSSCDEYLVEVQRATDDLSDTDFGKVRDPVLVAFLLAGLPDSYESLLQTIDQATERATSEEVKRRIRETWKRLNKNEPEAPASSSNDVDNVPAFFSGNHQNRGKSSWPRGRKTSRGAPRTDRCYECKGYGHHGSECPTRRKREQEENKGKQPNHQASQRYENRNPRANAALSHYSSHSDTESENDHDLLQLESPTIAKSFIVLSASTTTTLKDGWYLDSGCTHHMCADSSIFSMLQESPIKYILAADNKSLPVHAMGTVVLVSSLGKRVSFSNVLYVPRIAANLISVSCIDLKGGYVVIKNRECSVHSTSNNELLINGTLISKGIYRLNLKNDVNNLKQTNIQPVVFTTKPLQIELWHKRLAHINPQYLQHLQRAAPSSIQFKTHTLPQCEACSLGKLVRGPFHGSNNKAKQKLELIHTDICEMLTPSIGKALYFLSVLDDNTRCKFVYFLKKKSEAYDCLKHFIIFAHTQTGMKIKNLRSDKGGEYVSNALSQLLTSKGIMHQMSVPPNHESNGRAERLNRTLLEKARCMLYQAGLPEAFWAEAIATALYLSNRSPHSSTDMKIPQQLWDEKSLDLRHLRVFGCLAIGLIPTNRRKKIQATGDHYVMLGYATNQRAYRLWNLVDNKVHIVRDAAFYEDIFPFRPSSLTYSPSPMFEPTLPQTTEALNEDDEPQAEEPGLPAVQAPQLEQRQHTEPANHDIQQNANDQNFNNPDDENLLNETPDEIMPATICATIHPMAWAPLKWYLRPISRPSNVLRVPNGSMQ